MPTFDAVEALAAGWDEGQRLFWSAAAGMPAGDAHLARAPDVAAFDGFWTAFCAGLAPPERGEGWRDLLGAGARYRAVVTDAWRRVHAAFEVQRRAMIDPAGPPPDWRALRQRWFDLAEAEFIRTQRAPAFLEAQRGALGAVLRWHAELAPDERATVDAARAVAGVGARMAAALGLQHVRIATTAKDVVWREGEATLARYRPLGARPRPGPLLGPLLICYGLIGRQTMTDLTPERSLVRNLLAAGVDVFVLDWGDGRREALGSGFEDYAVRHLGAAFDAMLAASGAPQGVLLGICQGGTMAACHAALDPGRLAGLILAVTPIDFHADVHDADPAHGLLNLWLRSLSEAEIEAMIALDGTLSGEVIGGVFNQLNPVRTIVKYAVEFPEAAADPRALATFLAMEKWLADRPDLPGPLARAWLVELYHRNALVAGRFAPGGRPVELGRIGVPVLNIFATGDHIIPPPCSRALGRLVEPVRYQELALPTGHVGVFVSARAQALLAPAMVAWLATLA